MTAPPRHLFRFRCEAAGSKRTTLFQHAVETQTGWQPQALQGAECVASTDGGPFWYDFASPGLRFPLLHGGQVNLMDFRFLLAVALAAKAAEGGTSGLLPLSRMPELWPGYKGSGAETIARKRYAAASGEPDQSPNTVLWKETIKTGSQGGQKIGYRYNPDLVEVEIEPRDELSQIKAWLFPSTTRSKAGPDAAVHTVSVPDDGDAAPANGNATRQQGADAVPEPTPPRARHDPAELECTPAPGELRGSAPTAEVANLSGQGGIAPGDRRGPEDGASRAASKASSPGAQPRGTRPHLRLVILLGAGLLVVAVLSLFAMWSVSTTYHPQGSTFSRLPDSITITRRVFLPRSVVIARDTASPPQLTVAVDQTVYMDRRNDRRFSANWVAHPNYLVEDGVPVLSLPLGNGPVVKGESGRVGDVVVLRNGDGRACPLLVGQLLRSGAMAGVRAECAPEGSGWLTGTFWMGRATVLLNPPSDEWSVDAVAKSVPVIPARIIRERRVTTSGPTEPPLHDLEWQGAEEPRWPAEGLLAVEVHIGETWLARSLIVLEPTSYQHHHDRVRTSRKIDLEIDVGPEAWIERTTIDHEVRLIDASFPRGVETRDASTTATRLVAQVNPGVFILALGLRHGLQYGRELQLHAEGPSPLPRARVATLAAVSVDDSSSIAVLDCSRPHLGRSLVGRTKLLAYMIPRASHNLRRPADANRAAEIRTCAAALGTDDQWTHARYADLAAAIAHGN